MSPLAPTAHGMHEGDQFRSRGFKGYRNHGLRTYMTMTDFCDRISRRGGEREDGHSVTPDSSLSGSEMIYLLCSMFTESCTRSRWCRRGSRAIGRLLDHDMA